VTPRNRSLRSRIGHIAVDITPLRRSANFRRLWFGQVVSQVGTQMTTVALGIQVFAYTHSSFAVGLLGAFALIPMIAGGLYGGSLADSGDRRRIMLITIFILTLLSTLLWIHELAKLQAVWLLYVVVAVQAFVAAISQPTRQSVIPRLVGNDLLPAANALGQISFNIGFTVGPVLAGVVVHFWGFGAAYLVDAVSYLAVLYATWRLPVIMPEGTVQKAGIRSILTGLNYLRGRSNLFMTFLVDIVAMVFGMQRALYPALAVLFFAGGSLTVGILSAATAVGALVAALGSGWLGHIHHHGRAVIWAIMVWGASITLFGFSKGALWFGFLMLAIAGGADMVSAVFRSSILQTATPDELRGRLQGVFIAVVAGGPLLGDLRAGTVASWTSPQFAVVSGGIICMCGVLLLVARWRGFLAYDSRHPVP
jgi:MFS family permease